MCGIFFQASRSTIEYPSWLPKPLELHEEYFSLENPASTELYDQQISVLIAEDLARNVSLSDEDKHKISMVDRLRESQDTIKSLNNGKSKAAVIQGIESGKAEISRLSDQAPKDPTEILLHIPEVPTDILRAVLARGPDYAQLLTFNSSSNYFQLFSSVLSLRQPFTKQPLRNEGWILQFNGELYNLECSHSNDTAFIMSQILHEQRFNHRIVAVQKVIDRLQGEFAYVLFDTLEKKVYFGKDKIGKRSLLFTSSTDDISISSVDPQGTDQAVECKGNVMYIADLATYNIERRTLDTPVYLLDPPMQVNSKCDIETCLEELHARLRKSCATRQNTISPLHATSKDARFGVLFSGGLDCTVLTALLAANSIELDEECLIDLLTVGFDNPRTGLSASNSPDRLLSEQSWYELSKIYQGTKIRFRLAQIDVSYSEWLAHKKKVRNLIYPCATEMDLSIAIAFYFATQADGCELLEISGDLQGISWPQFKENKAHLVSRTDSYSSQAKVLFSGLGADELFGGYSRHENIFHGLAEDASQEDIHERYSELSLSLIHDIDVIYKRNLGRDDRAIATWGKELRYPYLDESFVKWVIENVCTCMKVEFEWVLRKTKKGEKRVMKVERKAILRKLAQKIGLQLASKELKRAIQFGAKSAKIEVGQHKAKGTDTL